MIRYISKDAVAAEIEKLESRFQNGSDEDYADGYHYSLKLLKRSLDTLEVKEVDLNEEYIEEIYSHIDGIRDTADRMTSGNFMHHRAAIKFSANVIEKVLGLIGLKAQKGE